MKKLFTEPEVEILKFLCNSDVTSSPDDGDLGGDGTEGGDIEDILP